MATVLQVAAAVQMGLGAVGFVAALGYYLLAIGKPGAGGDLFTPLGLLVLSVLVFTVGGVLWTSVHSAYRPPRAAAPAAAARSRDPEAGFPVMAAVMRVVSLVLMTYGTVGFAAVGYLWVVPGFAGVRGWQGSNYFVMVGLSLLAMHTVGIGGVIWGVQRLAYPPRPAAPPASPVG